MNGGKKKANATDMKGPENRVADRIKRMSEGVQRDRLG